MKKITFKKLFMLVLLILAANSYCQTIQLDVATGSSGASITDTFTLDATGVLTKNVPGNWTINAATTAITLAGAQNKTFDVNIKAATVVNTTAGADYGSITTSGSISRSASGDIGVDSQGIHKSEGVTFGIDASNFDTNVAVRITGIEFDFLTDGTENAMIVNLKNTTSNLNQASNGFIDISSINTYVKGGTSDLNMLSVFHNTTGSTGAFRIVGLQFEIVEVSTGLPFIWLGRNTDYSDVTNWLTSALPSGSDNTTIYNTSSKPVIFPTVAATTNNLDIADGASLEIRNGASLIVSGTTTDEVTFRRTITKSAVASEAWYLMASPVVGATFNDAFVSTNGIASSTVNVNNRGVATYNPGSDNWTYLTSGGTINSESGKGYSIKKDNTAANDFVYFNGTINTDNAGVTPTGLSAGFNLLGNPYTSYVNSGTFLAANANLDQTQFWLWNQSIGMYEAKGSGEGFMLAPTQGFFVKVNTGTSVNFAESNQASGSDTFQKSARTDLKLLMNDGTSNRFAKIYFTETATKGFDNGWEGEVFGGIANKLDVFTELVENNLGKNYQLQSLPLADLESTIIPVGVIAEAGKELTFSLEQASFPADVKVYLEDRISNTFNEISNNQTYKVTLNEALNDVGRFYLHTSSSALSVDDNLSLTSVSIYKTNATTLKLVGLPNGTSTIKLFNILGKQVVTTSFTANGVKEISLPNLSTGVYIVQLTTETSKVSKKIILE